MMKATMIAAAMASSAMGAQFVMYTPGGDDTAVERMDSIVSPGTISAHVHQIFGANKMSPDMTYEELLKSDCTTMGNAAGEGNAADKSVYWHPSGFMEAKDGSGYIRIPTNGHKLYYRDVGNDADKKREPFEFPAGFRMVAGDQTRRAANEDVKRQNITQWVCHNTGPWNQGTDGGFPSDYPDCPSFPGFNGAIHFPHCWNGEDFDQANPGAHVSYPDGDIQGGPCPSSHPIRLPHIFMETQFDLHKMVDKVKPNTFVLAQGDATGYGWHADFMNGWESGAIPELFDSCPQPYYGNADIGTCPTFKKFSTKTRDCKLKVTYEEEVDNSEFLPGCNPIQTTNPATKMQIAKQGVCSNQCQKASGSSASASSYSAPKADDSSDKTPAKESPAAPQYTTLATYAKSDNDAAPTPSSYAGNVVFETAYVTVTADSYKRDAAPSPGPARHQHAHRHIHKRHGKL